MDINHYNKPWKHFEVSNFLTSEELQKVRSYFDTLSVPDGITGEDYRQQNRHTTYHIPSHTNNSLTDMIRNRFIELCKKVDFYDPEEEEIHVDYERMYPGFTWHMHRDQFTKKISFILHISESGTGTRIHEKKDGSGDNRTAAWIVGGGNGFVNKDNTWHNFDVLDDTEIRKTVCITKRPKVKEKPPQWVLDKIATQFKE